PLTSILRSDVAGPGAPRARSGPPEGRSPRWGWITVGLVAPAALLTVAVQIHPTLYSFYLSFGTVSAGTVIPVGLDNYCLRLTSARFWQSVDVGLVCGVASVVMTFVRALALARVFYTEFRG